MTLALIALFRNDAGEVQIGRRDLQAHFLERLPASAGVRGFAALDMQLAAAGTPQSQVRLLRPFQQQHIVALIETIKQRGDFMITYK